MSFRKHLARSIIFSGLLTLALAVALFLSPSYFRSSMSVFVSEDSGNASTAAISQLVSGRSSGGQVDLVKAILSSDDLRLASAKTLNLPGDPTFWQQGKIKKKDQNLDRMLELLENIVRIKSEKGQILLTVETTYPDLSYRIATAFRSELQARMLASYKSEISYLEPELEKSGRLLGGMDRKLAQQRGLLGVLFLSERPLVEDFVRIYLEVSRSTSKLDADIAALKAELNSPGSDTSKLEVVAKLEGLQAERKVQIQTLNSMTLDVESIPTKVTEFVGLFRQVRLREKVTELLSTRLEETKIKLNTVQLPLKDLATPRRAVKPLKKRIILKSALLGATCFLAYWIILALSSYGKSSHSEQKEG